MTDEMAGAVDLITGHRLLALVMSYAVFPYIVLWIAVKCWPKEDPHRAEYLGEYEHVQVWSRPIWVGGVAVRCVLDGLSLRGQQRRHRRDVRVAASEPCPTNPNWFWVTPLRASLLPVPLCTFLALPEMVLVGWVSAFLKLPVPVAALLVVLTGQIAGERRIEGLYLLRYRLRRRRWLRATHRLGLSAVAN